MPRATLAIVLVLAPALSAQRFARRLDGFLPETSRSLLGAAADLDRDGDLDLVALQYDASNTQRLRMLVNDGEGRFGQSRDLLTIPTTGIGWTSVTAVDYDADGDVDLFVARTRSLTGATDLLLRNDGGLVFTDISSTHWPQTPDGTVQLLPVDLDGDGDLDVVACNDTSDWKCGGNLFCPQQNRIYRNDGTGRLTDVTATVMPHTPHRHTSAIARDLDGDGDIDLAFSVLDSAHFYPLPPGPSVRLFLQQANGAFVEGTGRIPVSPRARGANLLAFDLEGDGDPDLCWIENYGQERLLRNDGTAHFTEVTNLPSRDPAVRAAALALWDRDRDGDFDLLLLDRPDNSQYFYAPLPLRLWDNQAGTMVDRSVLAASVTAWPGTLHVFDADRDGDQDVWISQQGPARDLLAFGDAAGGLQLLEPFETALPGSEGGLLVDLDRDGHADALRVRSRYGSAPSLDWHENDGTGRFGAATTVLPAQFYSTIAAVAAADFDGDGDADVFAACAGTPGYMQDRLAQNDGTGNFTEVTAAAFPSESGAANAVVAGDIDRDGDQDLIVGNSGPNRAYRNDGTGTFTEVTNMALPASSINALAVNFCDFDHDGDLDLLTGSYAGTPGGTLRAFANDGAGRFADVPGGVFPAVTATVNAIVAGDVDRDGDLDVLLGAADGLRYLQNDGAVFGEVTSTHVQGQVAPIGLRLADADSDGDLDVFASVGANAVYSLMLFANDGAGHLILDLVGYAQASAWFDVADADHDGDPDFLGAFGLARNMHRQLQDALPPRLGFHGELLIHAAPGYATDPQAVLLFVAGSPARPPIGLGALGLLQIDPATMFLRSTHVLPPPAGSGLVRYLVPGAPALLGTGLFAQSLFLHAADPTSWRLGNLLQLAVRL